jgi:hypothetical protein
VLKTGLQTSTAVTALRYRVFYFHNGHGEESICRIPEGVGNRVQGIERGSLGPNHVKLHLSERVRQEYYVLAGIETSLKNLP